MLDDADVVVATIKHLQATWERFIDTQLSYDRNPVKIL